MYIYIYIYILYIYIFYSLSKSNNYLLKSAENKSVINIVGRRRGKATLLGT